MPVILLGSLEGWGISKGVLGKIITEDFEEVTFELNPKDTNESVKNWRGRKCLRAEGMASAKALGQKEAQGTEKESVQME